MALTPPVVPLIGDTPQALWADNTALGVIDYESACTTYVPVLTTSGTAANLGTGALAAGVYKVLGGRWCHFTATFVWGTSPTAGTGTYFMSLPLAWANDSIPPLFTAMLIKGNVYGYYGSIQTTTTLQFLRGDGTGTVYGAGAPGAPVAGDIFRVNGSYRIA